MANKNQSEVLFLLGLPLFHYPASEFTQHTLWMTKLFNQQVEQAVQETSHSTIRLEI